MPRINIPKKYLELLVPESEIVKARFNKAGTMPADIAAFRKLIASKLADKKLLEGLVNDCIQSGAVSVKLK